MVPTWYLVRLSELLGLSVVNYVGGPNQPTFTPTSTFVPPSDTPNPTPTTATSTPTAANTATPIPPCGPAWRVVYSPPGSGSEENILNGVAVVSADDVWAVGNTYNWTILGGNYGTLVEHWDGSQWSIVPSPHPGSYDGGPRDVLYGVAAVSANDVWAVGRYSDNGLMQTLIEHWDGTSWSIVPVPGPGSGYDILAGVAAVSANDVWAVGYVTSAAFGSTPGIILHWNGASWGSVSRPGPTCEYGLDLLNSIAVVSAHEVWAVGERRCNPFSTLVERFNDPCTTPTITPTNTPAGTTTRTPTGTPAPTDTATYAPTPTQTTISMTSTATNTAINPSPSATPMPTSTPTSTSACGVAWRVAPSPNTNGNFNILTGVAAVSASDVWAVGQAYVGNPAIYQTLIEHWNGSQWSIVPSPSPGSIGNRLNGVAVVSADDVWAVGASSNTGGPLQTLVEHWNGTQWSVVPSPNVNNGRALYGVAAVSANDVWAVGVSGNGQTLTIHWNGVAWSVVSSPNPAGVGWFNGVAALSANDVWAVGQSYESSSNIYRTLVEHWDGTAWSIVSSPGMSVDGVGLNAVAVVSANDVWAVGTTNSAAGTIYTLIEHWNGAAWSVVSSPNPGQFNILNAVAAVSANDVWAVGAIDTGSPALVLHWDGTNWSALSSPSPGNTDTYWLGSLAVVAANDVWAVGSQSDGSVDRTLAIHYSDPCATPTPTPTSTLTLTPTPTSTLTPTRTSTPMASRTSTSTRTIQATLTSTSTPACGLAWSVVSSPNPPSAYS